MAANAYFGRTILPAGKRGELKKNDNGYYYTCIGAFNTNNYSGVHYPFTPSVENLFSANGVFMRRVNGGNLRGEAEHPKPTKGMSEREWFDRLRFIDTRYVSHHILNIELVPTKDDNGQEIVAVYGWVRPAGNYREIVTDALTNVEENACFSIRSIASRAVLNGKICNIVSEVSTFDFVNEGGILQAMKYKSIGLESISDPYELEITPALIKASEESYDAGLESGAGLTTTMIRDSLGWNKVQLITPGYLCKNVGSTVW